MPLSAFTFVHCLHCPTNSAFTVPSSTHSRHHHTTLATQSIALHISAFHSVNSPRHPLPSLLFPSPPSSPLLSHTSLMSEFLSLLLTPPPLPSHPLPLPHTSLSFPSHPLPSPSHPFLHPHIPPFSIVPPPFPLTPLPSPSCPSLPPHTPSLPPYTPPLLLTPPPSPCTGP